MTTIPDVTVPTGVASTPVTVTVPSGCFIALGGDTTG